MSLSIVNINSAVHNVLKDGGSLMKVVPIVDNKFCLFKQKTNKKLPEMMFHKTLHKMMTTLYQDVHNVGQISMKEKKRKSVSVAVVISFIKDVKCFLQDIGNAIIVWTTWINKEGKFIQ